MGHGYLKDSWGINGKFIEENRKELSEDIGSHDFFIVCLPIQPFVPVTNKQNI